MEHKQTAILLATYNGERYLEEQLNSLFRQTDTDWTLYVHDDGSQDNTPKILENFAKEHSNMIVLQYAPTGGAMSNFLSLLHNMEADYYFFCDQDDIWVKEKVEREKSEIQLLEKQKGEKCPIIVYSDLRVVDSNLDVIAHSFWQYTGIKPQKYRTFAEAGTTNFVTGCTMLFNNAAKQALKPANAYTCMHDAWLVQCIFSVGGIVHNINEQLVLYRQHGRNELGAKDKKSITIAYRLKHFYEMQRRNWLQYKMVQALGYGSFLRFWWNKILLKIKK